MKHVLLASLLMFTPFFGVSAENAETSLNADFNGDQNEPYISETIENFRVLFLIYKGLTTEEKKEFLAELEFTEEEFQVITSCSNLNWKADGKYPLPLSNSTISIPRGYILLTGKDVDEFYAIEGDLPTEGLEAYVCESENFGNSVIFENINAGYIPIDDWKELDAKELLKSITDNTENANKERKERGLPEIHVLGWIQEPTLDRITNTVYWAIEADSGEADNLVNSVALRLGREGFERITWVTSRSAYIPFGGHLDILLQAHSFDPGYRYNDYKIGDKIAEYGIAGLVAASVGGKLVKAGGIAALLKKVGGLLVAGIAAIFYKIKNYFQQKRKAS
jgi:uncharacterized membrane-anchored protein